MNFNPFNDLHWPFPGCASKNKQSGLQDRAEDIEFEEVKESASGRPKIDQRARAEQISKAVAELTGELKTKDPIFGLFRAILFISGAEWADSHPLSEFGSHVAWVSAQQGEVRRMLMDSKANTDKDHLFEAILFATFARGAIWANENPAPTL